MKWETLPSAVKVHFECTDWGWDSLKKGMNEMGLCETSTHEFAAVWTEADKYLKRGWESLDENLQKGIYNDAKESIIRQLKEFTLDS